MAARGQFGDGSTPKFAHYISVYLCAKIGAFIKKCTIGLNIIGKLPHYSITEPLRISGTRFYGLDAFISPTNSVEALNETPL